MNSIIEIQILYLVPHSEGEYNIDDIGAEANNYINSYSSSSSSRGVHRRTGTISVCRY